MDWRVIRLTQEVEKHDRMLKAVRTNTGMIQIWRQAEHWAAAELIDGESDDSQPMQFILALTDDWGLTGNPIDIGIEPLMRKIQHMDSWNKVGILDDMRKRREAEAEEKKRQRANENKAIAADMRTEFAKAVNDINTSSLDMTDARSKYGISQ